ncbi:YihY/virulence factor BrkB family protein [Salegentibacter sp. JZCK2]|uniref:YihY/virulence factor BrkB family protein n=1 Tax=Salegentibacter tibetensis TaxID=2873600 RepID=UPI001CCABB06|nr:YihY/virulence factor BrkB family protein [Salegentibacter tibetensis]MBZ9728963.1 YihY/virulence factor BrkB family protein [Salegentibacter tibetensis]
MSKFNQDRPKINSPSKISFSGWKKIAFIIKDKIGENNLTIVSAGVAFYAFLAIFPAVMALVSIYGLAVTPAQIENQLTQLGTIIPEEAFGIVEERLENFISTSGSTLGWGMIIGILFSIWSANKGMKSLFTGIDIAYATPSERGFIKQNALTLLFTFAAIILVILSMGLIVVFPALVEELGLPQNIENLISWLRWPILAIIVGLFLCIVYKYAPERTNPKLRWVIPGALVATILWLIASWGFSFYVSNFGSYGEVYGSIAAVVIMMLWLFITCFTILLGAQINSASERYAKKIASFN